MIELNQEMLHAFASPFIAGPLRVVPLQKDLSRRTYFALESDSQRVVLAVHADPRDAAIGDFEQIASFLQAGGIGVPTVLAIDRERGWVLQSEAGTSDLSREMSPAARAAHYERLIDLIIRLQGLTAGDPVKSRSFDEPKLKFEIGLFESRLAASTLGLPPIPFEFSMFLQSVCEKLARAEGLVFAHRDLHSKNVMISPSNDLVLIDFQDARMGLPWYDVASLIYDPYVDLGRDERQRLLNLYVHRSEKRMGLNLFFLQALQRTLKAAGTYLGVLAQEPSKFYLDSLRRAFGYLEEIVQLGGFPDHGFVFAMESSRSLEKLPW
jgi:aminoglycoside/choline kinase family phosphotransferase